MALLPNGLAKTGVVAGFYPQTINQSLRFEDGDSSYLSWTPASAGNRKTWTWSGWVKRGNISGYQYLFASGNATPWAGILFSDNGTNSRIQITFTAGSSGGTSTTAEFRDPSAWYHIVVAVDTTQATASDRIKLYINGTQITNFASTNYPALDFQTQINNSILHTLGRQPTAATAYYDGYLAEVHFTDGTAYTADDFGELKSGIWVPKADISTTVTYGTNGFYLPFNQDTTVEGFNTVVYQGSDTYPRSITGVGFEPDLIWIKGRSQAYSHVLYDSIRGTGANFLASNLTAAEGANSQNANVTSFDSDGFTIGSTASTNIISAGTSNSYVAWCLDAGDAFSNSAGTNGATIASSGKANPNYGFSIVSYTGSGSNGTIYHGLNSTPEMVIYKKRDSAGNWWTHHKDTTANYYLLLNSTAAAANQTTLWPNEPSGSVFSVGTESSINGATGEFIAYCFHSVDGFSKVGSYVGNQSEDGTFIFTGFRPKWVMVKRVDSADNWSIWNAGTYPYNVMNGELRADEATVENTLRKMDFVSNGFKLREGTYWGTTNASGGTYIYLAFAEQPFKYSNAR